MMYKIKVLLILLSFLTTPLLGFAEAESATSELEEENNNLEKDLVGWIEKVKLSPSNITLEAKLDTGADNCSLNAQDIKKFKRKGQTWVKFKIKNREKKEKTIELPVIKQTRIKRVKGKSQVRPVVRLGLCLGSKYSEVDVNLADRSNFAYPLLVGRSFLSAHVVLDPSRTYTTEPNCKSD